MRTFFGNLGLMFLVALLAFVPVGTLVEFTTPLLYNLDNVVPAYIYGKVQLFIILFMATIIIIRLIIKYAKYKPQKNEYITSESFFHDFNLECIIMISTFVVLSIFTHYYLSNNIAAFLDLTIAISALIYTIVMIFNLCYLASCSFKTSDYIKLTISMVTQFASITVLLLIYLRGNWSNFDFQIVLMLPMTVLETHNAIVVWFSFIYAEFGIYISTSLVGVIVSAIAARIYQSTNKATYKYLYGISLSKRTKLLEKSITEYQPMIQTLLEQIRHQCIDVEKLSFIRQVTNAERVEYYDNFELKMLDCFHVTQAAATHKPIDVRIDELQNQYKNLADLHFSQLSFIEKGKKNWDEMFMHKWASSGVNVPEIELTAHRCFQMMLDTLRDTYTKSKEDMQGTLKGEHGENVVHEMLKRVCQDTDAILIKNINIKYEDTSAEIDDIVISKYGVLLIEVKNIGGENSNYEYVIRSDYQEYRRYENGDLKPVEKSICGQIAYHQEAFIHMLRATHCIGKNDNPYHFVKSILVVANNQLKLENLSNLIVTRANSLTHCISHLMNDALMLNVEQIQTIQHAIQEYIVSPKSFEIVDCYEKMSKWLHNGIKILNEYQSIIDIFEKTYGGQELDAEKLIVEV